MGASLSEGYTATGQRRIWLAGERNCLAQLYGQFSSFVIREARMPLTAHLSSMQWICYTAVPFKGFVLSQVTEILRRWPFGFANKDCMLWVLESARPPSPLWMHAIILRTQRIWPPYCLTILRPETRPPALGLTLCRQPSRIQLKMRKDGRFWGQSETTSASSTKSLERVHTVTSY